MSILKKFFTNKTALTVVLVAVMLVIALLCLAVGPVRLGLKEILSVLFGGERDTSAARIVLNVRLPRMLAALLSGVGLAVAGVLLQTMLHNPLASTGIVGVNAGSGLFSLIAAVFLPAAYLFRPLFAFIGALIAAVAVFFLAYKTSSGRTTVILSGVAVSSFLTAIIDLLITLYPSAGVDRLAFTIGGFSGVSMNTVLFGGGAVLLGLGFSLLLSHDYNVLYLGEETAGALGMRTGRFRFIGLVLVALMSGGAISMCGLLGFVGLLIPHFVRLFTGNDHKWLIPLSAVCGGAFTMLCDLIARTAFAPYELPVGILLSLIGAPFFLLLLFGRRGGRHVKFD